jgi:predicted ATPase
MEGKRLIQTLRLKNLLSYGSEGEKVTLEPLNVLIGPNASGKSNLIEAIALLRAMPKDVAAAVREGGGIGEWLWKGARDNPAAEIEALIDYPEKLMPLRYVMHFAVSGQRFEIVHESVADEQPDKNEDTIHFFYRYLGGNQPEFNVRKHFLDGMTAWSSHSPEFRKFSVEQSVLAQVKDPSQYPELAYLSNQFSSIRLYRWDMGRKTELRKPQLADLPIDFLEEDASNLGLVINDLEHQGLKSLLIEYLEKFYEPVNDVTVRVYGGTTLTYLHEKGFSRPVSVSRLSDGTLRYLCLLTVLCHPAPPPLICIEEPELGLHPDILPTIAELLVEASQRTQLIVTTHSADLVSALRPESVLVCERDEATGSHLRRLEPEPLEEWLKEFSLGHLWRMGEIGGTRW